MAGIGGRDWLSKVQTTLDSGRISNFDENITAKYFKKLLRQAKKLSHIISFVWLDEDHENAQKLDGYFRRGNDDELKKLLFANEVGTEEYELLLKVFKEAHYLPVFDEEDKEFIKFRVVTDRFEGNISEPEPSDESILTVSIAYPPRPPITDDIAIPPSPGYAVIKKSELKDWLKQPPHEKPYFSDNPYIVPSSC